MDMGDGAYCVFDTPLGTCGIAWSTNGKGNAVITGFGLPEATARQTGLRMAERCGAVHASAPPPAVKAMIMRIGRHLSGDTQDFSDIALDLRDSPDFARKVYIAARKIRAGQTRTYGDLARAIGRPRAARAVGQALGRNPIALLVPCHRVLAAGNKPGGFSAHGGCTTKSKLLELEGATLGASAR
jgi:O-6-methylguanine DNA methyltransferase